MTETVESDPSFHSLSRESFQRKNNIQLLGQYYFNPRLYINRDIIMKPIRDNTILILQSSNDASNENESELSLSLTDMMLACFSLENIRENIRAQPVSECKS